VLGAPVRGTASGKPQLVPSFLEFQRTFGGFLPAPDPNLASRWASDPVEGGRWWTFPLSVQGFFVNGGERLFVKRVVSSAAGSSAGVLSRGVVSEITADAARGDTTLQVRHLLGFAGVGTEVTVVRGADQREVHHSTVVAYHSTGPTIELAQPLPEEVRAA